MNLRLSSLLAAMAFVAAVPFNAWAVGAIAVDDEVGDTDPGYGIVTGMDSEQAAKAGAMQECRASGNKNCRVAVWFNKCGAYASSRKNEGIGYGSSKSVAERKALDECGASGCRIVVSDCE
ncbi:MAG: hypothetical protein RLZZ612_697 [Pseudomonadota bacterium]|jgi:hypothetical protein